jgi:site-specific DNA recombinase
VARIVRQRAYSGVHEVNLENGEVIERPVPAIVSSSLQERAVRALAENKRYAGGKAQRHDYLLRGLVYCAGCGVVYVGSSATPSRAKKTYAYYSCSRRRRTYDGRTKTLSCPHVATRWLEETVWADVRQFLENPEEALEDARAQLEAAGEDGELEARLESLTKRLATKQAEKDRYVRAFAQAHISEDDLALYVADIKNQVENLKLLISSVESDLAAQEQEKLAAADAATWLLTLRERLAEVEADTAEARRMRRELVRLLVQQISVGSNEDGATEVQITYRFGPPASQEEDTVLHGVANFS